MAAFEAVPREYFHYLYSEHRATPGDAYEDTPKPWGAGLRVGAVGLSRPGLHDAGLSSRSPADVTLEIGTGSGFQSALLSRIVKQAYSIEIIEPLGKAVSKIFAPLGYDNVHTRVGDGYYGWPEVQGGFDIIIVTCAAQYAPPDLFKQMKPGGRLVIPIGQPFKRGQVLYVYTKDAEGKIHSKRDMGVFFIPMTGAIAKTPAPHAARGRDGEAGQRMKPAAYLPLRLCQKARRRVAARSGGYRGPFHPTALAAASASRPPSSGNRGRARARTGGFRADDLPGPLGIDHPRRADSG